MKIIVTIIPTFIYIPTFICEFWEVFQITSLKEHLWETAYFMYNLQSFNHQIQ